MKSLIVRSRRSPFDGRLATVTFPVLLIYLTLGCQLPAWSQSVNVLTQHNDNGRTGANLFETKLNTSNVGSGQFGMLFSLPVDGQIYAQPLYVSNLRFPDRVHNVVYVATMHNTVYAFDADKPSAPLWTKKLGKPVAFDFMPMFPAKRNGLSDAETAGIIAGAVVGGPAIDLAAAGVILGFKLIPCGPGPAGVKVPHNISDKIGITSTPVIDLDSKTIYVVRKVAEDDGSFNYYLHALDLLTGNDRPRSPVQIAAQAGNITFKPKVQLQRPGLLLVNNKVYVAFGAHQDTTVPEDYHGWVLAYDKTTLIPTKPFITTPTGKDGGIWQSGNGLAADDSGNIYFMVGNGTYDMHMGGSSVGDSFVKLRPDLTLLDWFTPENCKDLDTNDADLGSAGPLLIPGTSFLVGGGKDGKFFLLDRNSMGHLEDGHSPGDHHAAQNFQAADSPGAINNCGLDFHNIHGSPVVWQSSQGTFVYIWAERDNLRQFKFDSQRFSKEDPLFKSKMKDPEGDILYKPMPGASLSVSANGHTPGTGVLWAALPLVGDAVAADVPGILRAFDAGNVERDLWCGSVGTFSKFNSPTIANGKVYVATLDGRLNVYGTPAHLAPSPSNERFEIKSPPVTFKGNVFFQGKDDKLVRVSMINPSDVDEYFGGYKTKSTPFISDDGYLFFRGGGGGRAEDRLVKVSTSRPNQDNHIFDDLKIKSSPFVSQGFVYYQGTDDKLWRVRLSNPKGDEQNLGGYKTKSPPFVAGGFVYFQAGGSADDRLMKVNIISPNGPNNNLGGFKTKSSPVVFKNYVYFQGTDDKLWKVNINNPNGDNDNLHGFKTKSTPRVVASPPGSTFPDFIYFQGTDDRLWRVGTDAKGLANPNCGNWTKSTPFVDGNRIFFQGTNDRLVMAWAWE